MLKVLKWGVVPPNLKGHGMTPHSLCWARINSPQFINRFNSMRADGPDRPSSSYGCITRDLEMNSRMLGGPGVSVRGLCPLPGVGALVHVRAAPGS